MPPTAVAPEVPTLVLEPSGRAPSLARRFVADRLREWGIADDSDARVVVMAVSPSSLVVLQPAESVA